MLSRDRSRPDGGQLTLLVIGYTVIAALLVVAAIDASKVFLARRALSSAADAAALAAAQTVDRSAIYSGGSMGCGGLLPLDGARASDAARAVLDDDLADLEHSFVAFAPPETTVDAGTVTVRLAGDVALPFGHVLGVLLPGDSGGKIHLTVTSSAQSPLTTPGGC
jgi:hypothetical protein